MAGGTDCTNESGVVYAPVRNPRCVVRLQVGATVDSLERCGLVTGLAFAARSKQYIVFNGLTTDIEVSFGLLATASFLRTKRR